MRDSQRKQRGQGVIENLSVRPVELRNRRQDESQRHALEEVGMAAQVDGERIRGIIGGIFKTVTHVFIVLDTLEHNTVGQDQQVRGKGECPGAGNSCFNGLVKDVQRGVA